MPSVVSIRRSAVVSASLMRAVPQPAVEAGHLSDDDDLNAAGVDVGQERVVSRAGLGGVPLALRSSSECVTASVQPSPSM
jgi:hypothetical protein